jgi:methionine-rich copper-binding protein CopC
MKPIAFAVVLVAAGSIAASVHAHAVLKSAEPAPSAVVKGAPKQLRLQFNEAVLAPFTRVTVTGPDGKPLHAGPVVVDSRNKAVVTAPVHGAGAPGAYKVEWTAATSDMHKISGGYTFTVRP